MNHPPSKATLDVLISEDGLREFFSAIITDLMRDNRELRLRVHASTHAVQIMAMDGRTDFDLFILMRNNVVFPSDNKPPDKTLKQALRFVEQLKARYQKPIIGLFRWPKEQACGRLAKMAGVDFVFGAPSKVGELRAAIEECLRRVLG